MLGAPGEPLGSQKSRLVDQLVARRGGSGEKFMDLSTGEQISIILVAIVVFSVASAFLLPKAWLEAWYLYWHPPIPKPIDTSWHWKEGPMTAGQMKQIAYDDIGFCGCGNPSQVAEMLSNVLNDPNPRGFGLSGEFILYVLNDAGLLEHGSNVHRSWRTKKGEAWMEAVRRHGSKPWLEGTLDYSTGEII